MTKRTPKKEELHNLLPIIPDLSNIIYEYIGCPLIIVFNISSIITIPIINSETSFIIDWVIY